MGYKFVEVFRENVPIAVRLHDLLRYVKKARELRCYEMRIVVSFDPANPGINLIFGRLVLEDKLKAGSFFPDFDYKVNIIPGIDISDVSVLKEDYKSHISDALDAQSGWILGWLEIAKEVPKFKRRLFLNDKKDLESTYLDKLQNKNRNEWEKEYLCSPLPEEPETLNDKNGKTNNNRR